MSLLLAGTLFAAIAVIPASAQNGSSNAVVSDFLKVYSTSSGKVVQLADAIPEDAYNWRPAEGVRSVGEAILHVAGSNYFFATKLGAHMPEGVDPRSFDPSAMSKDEMIAALKASVEFMKNTLSSMGTDTLNEEIDMFGDTATKRQMIFAVGDHTGEHLGQLIAYARSNNVTPPWSRSDN